MESLKNIDIRELLPQKGRFVMVDELKYFDEKTVKSCFKVKSDNIFVSGNLFDESGIIENMAQTAAARMGYIGKYLDRSGVKIGFIGEIKNLVIKRQVCADEELLTEINIVNEIFSTLLVRSEVKIDGELIASCEMKIFLTDIKSN